MSRSDFLRLILLSAIWGASFIFMRVLSPQIGPILTAFSRVAIAGVALTLYFKATSVDLQVRQYWRQYVVIGVLNSSIPFLLYAFAALHLPASYLAILNAMSPLWSLIFSAIWLEERFTPWNFLGILVGACGVALVTKLGPVDITPIRLVAVLCCLGATACYGLSGVYLKRRASAASPLAIAALSQLFAGVIIMPVTPFASPEVTISVFKLVLFLLALSLLSSAVAYILYFRLVSRYGPTRALTTSFLIPLFGMLWGFLFLQEQISAIMLVGAGLVIAGTALVLRKRAPTVVAKVGVVTEE